MELEKEEIDSQYRVKITIFVITGAMALIAMVANILLANILSQNVYGKLGFVIMIAPLLSVLSLLGKDIWLLRLIASSENGIRWKPLTSEIIAKSSAVVTLVLGIVFYWAKYPTNEILLVVLIGNFYMVTHLLTFCLRALNRDLIGLLLLRITPLTLLGIAALCYLTSYDSSIFIIGLLTFGYFIQCILTLLVTFRIRHADVASMANIQPSSNSIYFYSMSSLLLLQSDRFICKMLYGFEAYAIYHATKIIVRPIQLVFETVGYYSMPRLAGSHPAKQAKKLIFECAIIAIFLGIVYFFVGNLLFEYFFGDNFGSHRYLVLSVSLLEIIALVQIPLTIYIQASAKKKQLLITGFVGLTSIIVIFTFYLMAYKTIVLPMYILPLCVGLIYIIRATFIWKNCKESFREV